MEKSQYLQALRGAPYAYPAVADWVPGENEWLAEAWELPEVQASVATDLVEEVRKWPPEPFLDESMPIVKVLAKVLSAAQVERLYRAFRERWPVCEPQLKDEFSWTFGDRGQQMPAPFRFRDILERLSGDPEAAVSLMLHYDQHPALPAGATLPRARNVHEALRWVGRMVDVGWLATRADFDELLLALRDERDLVVEEGAFEWMGEPREIRVTFLDENVACLPSLLVPTLEVYRDRRFSTIVEGESL